MIPLAIDQGGSGEVVRVDREVLFAVIDRAFAPGAPLGLSITLDGEALSVGAKTIGSKRREDGRFDVKMRLINLTRELRARLAALEATA